MIKSNGLEKFEKERRLWKGLLFLSVMMVNIVPLLLIQKRVFHKVIPKERRDFWLNVVSWRKFNKYMDSKFKEKIDKILNIDYVPIKHKRDASGKKEGSRKVWQEVKFTQLTEQEIQILREIRSGYRHTLIWSNMYDGDPAVANVSHSH